MTNTSGKRKEEERETWIDRKREIEIGRERERESYKFTQVK